MYFVLFIFFYLCVCVCVNIGSSSRKYLIYNIICVFSEIYYKKISFHKLWRWLDRKCLNHKLIHLINTAISVNESILHFIAICSWNINNFWISKAQHFFFFFLPKKSVWNFKFKRFYFTSFTVSWIGHLYVLIIWGVILVPTRFLGRLKKKTPKTRKVYG